MTAPRVVLVAKRSAYQRLVVEEQDPRARALLARRDPSVARWMAAHEEHQRTLDATLEALERLGARVARVSHAHAAFDTADAALVVVVGGDGTLLAASHNVGAEVPILGVNSAPGISVGFFCGARRSSVRRALEAALLGAASRVVLQRMTVTREGRVCSHRVLNEVLYCHASPAATSRYILRVGREREEQRSSGLWVGPAAGSTAAQRSAGGRVLPLESDALQLVVREPYTPLGKRYRLLRVVVERGQEVVVLSKMQDARLFLDGPESTVAVRLGEEVRFRLSPEPLTVLGLTPRRATRRR